MHAILHFVYCVRCVLVGIGNWMGWDRVIILKYHFFF
jgi:hypothetical protein